MSSGPEAVGKIPHHTLDSGSAAEGDVVGESRRRRPSAGPARVRRLVAASVVPLVGLVATACGTGSPTPTAGRPVDVDAVVTATEHAATFRFTSRSVAHFAGHSIVWIDESGVIDESQDASEVIIQPSSPGGPVNEDISIGPDVWTRNVASKPGGGTPWELLTSSSAENVLAADGGVDPTSYLGTLAQLVALGGHLVYVGPARIGTVETSHYRLDVAIPLYITAQLRRGIRGKLGKSARGVLGLWIDDAHLLRKVTQAVSIAGGNPKTDAAFEALFGGTVTMTFSDFGAAATILPPGSFVSPPGT